MCCVFNCCRIYHYSINKLSNEKFMIPDGKTFKTPVEFISRHQAFKDNLITKLETPCCRLEGQLPVAFRGVSYHQLEKELVLEAKKMVCCLLLFVMASRLIVYQYLLIYI